MTSPVSATLQQVLNEYALPWSIYSLDGLLLCSNPALDAMFGFPMAPMIGQYNVFSDETARANGYLEPLLAAREGQFTTLPTRHHQRPDGTDVWFEGMVFGNRDAAGQIVSLSTVFVDITSKKQTEKDLLRRSEEALLAQQASLRELSTPLIPLAAGIVVMPLVGSIDGQRAQLIMETLLEGISSHQADVAILDITGVPVVDTQVADALLRAARAARLLGAQIVLTGIGSHIAQTLITVGADLSGLVTLNNLQSGIAYALQQINDTAGPYSGA
jgi:rsbT co-antagonist protein RsbR